MQAVTRRVQRGPGSGGAHRRCTRSPGIGARPGLGPARRRRPAAAAAAARAALRVAGALRSAHRPQSQPAPVRTATRSTKQGRAAAASGQARRAVAAAPPLTRSQSAPTGSMCGAVCSAQPRRLRSRLAPSAHPIGVPAPALAGPRAAQAQLAQLRCDLAAPQPAGQLCGYAGQHVPRGLVLFKQLLQPVPLRAPQQGQPHTASAAGPQAAGATVPDRQLQALRCARQARAARPR